MIGKTISHYTILEELGRGGMGVVYKAEDTKLERIVALKFLPPEMAHDAEVAKRFLHEARAASALDHPNICTIHEIEESEGYTFIVQSYIEGQSLKERIGVGPLPVDDALQFVLQIARGLAAAHERGIVHRDIKPANIMLTEKDEPKIMDFGLAKSIGGTHLTRTGTTIGTVSYMSPEQTRGEQVDRRADIWSLGVILYEMLTGWRPFGGDYEQAVIYAVINEPHAPLTGVRTGIPLELERIVDKCLAKDPAMRYQHADELIVDLRRLQGDVSSTVSHGARGRSVSKGRSVGFAPSLVAVIVIVLIAVVGYLVFKEIDRSRRLEPAAIGLAQWKNSIAVLPFRDLSPERDQEYFCDGMTDALNGRLSYVNELKVISTTSVMRFKETELDIKDIGAELEVAHIVEGTIQREGDRIRVRAQLINAESGFHLWSDTYDEHIESVFGVQDRISESIANALQLQLAPAGGQSANNVPKNIAAYEYYMKGMHFIKSKFVVSFREEDFEAGVAMFDRSIEIDPDFALAYFGLAWAYEHHFHVTDSEDDAGKMQAACEKAAELDPNSALMSALNAYYLYEYKNEYDEAFRFAARAMEINPNIGEVNFLAGMCYLYHGLYEQGIPLMTRAIELDPYYFWIPYKLAMCYMGIGEFDTAARYFEKYFELAPVVLIFPGRYIALKIKMNQFDEVEKLIARTEEMYPDYWGLPYARALLLAVKGRKEEALSLYKNSEVYALLGMNDEAFESLDEEIRKTVLIPYVFYFDLVNNPFYDNLHGDSRFRELVAREKKLYDEYSRKYGRQ